MHIAWQLPNDAQTCLRLAFAINSPQRCVKRVSASLEIRIGCLVRPGAPCAATAGNQGIVGSAHLGRRSAYPWYTSLEHAIEVVQQIRDLQAPSLVNSAFDPDHSGYEKIVSLQSFTEAVEPSTGVGH